MSRRALVAGGLGGLGSVPFGSAALAGQQEAGDLPGAAVDAPGSGEAGGAADATGTAEAAGREPERPAGGRSMVGVRFERHRRVRLGVVGVGNRGLSVIREFLRVPSVSVTAIADTYGPRARSAAAAVVEAGGTEPALYTGGAPSYDTDPDAAYRAALEASRAVRWPDGRERGEREQGDRERDDPRRRRDRDRPDDDYRALCEREDIDLVYVATPWEWHHPVAIAALNAGKHVAVELPLAMEIEHLWQLVDASERTRKHCIQLENVSYGRNELRLLRMAHSGLFGEVTHAAGGYIHDLRRNLFFRENRDSDLRGIPYRRGWHVRRDGCLYPNHGLAPVAAYLDVNRGDRFVRLASTSTPALGLADFREREVPADHPAWDESYANGDRNVCLLETALGRRVRLEHDVTSPTPYTRINALAGTRGRFEDYEPRIYLEPDMAGHEWGSFDDYADHDHWLWTDIGDGGGGHGGMDYLMAYRLVQTMRLGLAPDIDVYDSATWSAPVALSAASLRRGGRAVRFPDFTRGEWRDYRPGLDTERPEE